MTAAIPDSTILEVLSDRMDLILLYRFGSSVRGVVGQHAGSDLDLAFLAGEPMDPLRTFECANELSTALQCDVDLVDLACATTVMRKEVITGGRCLFARSTSARDTFEMRSLADYVRLNEERAPVLERL